MPKVKVRVRGWEYLLPPSFPSFPLYLFKGMGSCMEHMYLAAGRYLLRVRECYYD